MEEGSVHLRVIKTLAIVPEGAVVSYGQLADLCGLPGRARLIGKCLREINEPINWHRVLRADGKIAFPEDSEKSFEQKQRLTEEGVIVLKGRVNMIKFCWKPDLHIVLSELKY